MRPAKAALTLGLAAGLLISLSPGSASAARGGGSGGRVAVFAGPHTNGVRVITRRPGQTVIASGTTASPLARSGVPRGTFDRPFGPFGDGVGPGFLGGGYLLDGGYQGGSDRLVLLQSQPPGPVEQRSPAAAPPRVEQTPFGVTIYRGSGPSG